MAAGGKGDFVEGVIICAASVASCVGVEIGGARLGAAEADSAAFNVESDAGMGEQAFRMRSSPKAMNNFEFFKQGLGLRKCGPYL
jgi:hypothetical protein